MNEWTPGSILIISFSLPPNLFYFRLILTRFLFHFWPKLSVSWTSLFHRTSGPILRRTRSLDRNVLGCAEHLLSFLALTQYLSFSNAANFWKWIISGMWPISMLFWPFLHSFLILAEISVDRSDARVSPDFFFYSSCEIANRFYNPSYVV